MGVETALIIATLGAAAWSGYTQYRSAEQAEEAAKKSVRRQEGLAAQERARRELEERQAAMQFLRRRQRALAALQGPGDTRDLSALGALAGSLGQGTPGGKHLLGA